MLSLLQPKNKLPDDADQMHLCYLGEEGYQAQHTKLFRELSADPRYRCEHCGRIAHDAKNLCAPTKL
jgi:hypothetical protein